MYSRVLESQEVGLTTTCSNVTAAKSLAGYILKRQMMDCINDDTVVIFACILIVLIIL